MRPAMAEAHDRQAGFILRRSDLVAGIAPELPRLDLDMCVADSQGSLGYILASTLQGRLRSAGMAEQVVALVTHTVVEAGDPAFGDPSKPIGSFYPEAVARSLQEVQGWTVVEDAGRGWRRVVPSPRPVRVVEQDATPGGVAEEGGRERGGQRGGRGHGARASAERPCQRTRPAA